MIKKCSVIIDKCRKYMLDWSITMMNLMEKYFTKLKGAVDNLDKESIKAFIDVLSYAYKNDKNIFVMGNGGSALTASHFVCDIAKGVLGKKEKRFKVICLNDNIASIMAYANDMSYEDVFVEQLKNLLQKGDVVIGLSGSGNSKNVVKAVEYANSKEAVTVGLTGYDGGILRKLCMHSVNSNIDDMQISEDIHLMVMHLSMQILNATRGESITEISPQLFHTSEKVFSDKKFISSSF